MIHLERGHAYIIDTHWRSMEPKCSFQGHSQQWIWEYQGLFCNAWISSTFNVGVGGRDPGEPFRSLEVLLLGQRRNFEVCLKAEDKVGIHGPSLPTGANSQLAFPLGLQRVCVCMCVCVCVCQFCPWLSQPGLFCYHKRTLNLWQNRNKHHNGYWKTDSTCDPLVSWGPKEGVAWSLSIHFVLFITTNLGTWRL